jgi:hypothetical protein
MYISDQRSHRKITCMQIASQMAAGSQAGELSTLLQQSKYVCI